MLFKKAALSAIVALSTGVAVSKNVFDPKFTDEQIHNVALELEQKEFQLGEREAKNIVDLNLVYDEDLALKKRDAKNVFDAQLVIDDVDLKKRDGKNVFDLNLVIDDAGLQRRDGKNIFNLDLVFDESQLQKRDAKNVVTVNFVIDDDSDLVKRGVEDVVKVSLTLPGNEPYLSSFEDPMSLGYIIGDSEYTAESFEKSDENLDVRLKSDSEGCHSKKNILHFESLSEILTTFKKKMLDPTIGSKDKVPIAESLAGDDVTSVKSFVEPIDIASAISARSDLSLFAKYLRELPELYHKCEKIDTLEGASSKEVLIFAPTNDAMIQLAKKPWQFPEDVDAAKSEEEQDEAIKRNVYNFVESHVAEAEGVNFSRNSKAVKIKTFNGKTVILENNVEKFRIRSEESDEWSDITNIETFDNGAILTLVKPLIH